MTSDENQARLFAPAEPVAVAGWTAELRNDELADISFRGTPVLRAIRAVVRDQDWRTLVPTVRRVASHDSGGGSTILLDIDYEGFGARYTGELAIHIAPETLKATFDGVAPAAFRSNRIGLVVLHPPDDAGRTVTVGSPGGGSSPSSFPLDISPHQPFLDVSSMEWERSGTGFRIDFAGDIFETEDQRNWTDASFKTYSTPLSRPFPVDVAEGDRVRQSVLLTAMPGAGAPGSPAGHRTSGAVPAEALPEANVLTVLDRAAARVPALTVSAPSGSAAGSAHRLEPIAGLAGLLLELRSGADAEIRVREATAQAADLGVPLDVRMAVAAPEQIPELLEMLPLQVVERLAVFDAASLVTEPALWAVLKAESTARGFAGTLLAGAGSHFTELNRNAARLPKDADALAYSITPQTHATEVPHIIETLPMQRLTAGQCPPDRFGPAPARWARDPKGALQLRRHQRRRCRGGSNGN